MTGVVREVRGVRKTQVYRRVCGKVERTGETGVWEAVVLERQMYSVWEGWISGRGRYRCVRSSGGGGGGGRWRWMWR